VASYENGKIPPSLLRRVSNFRPLYSDVNSNVGSDLLREDAWAALNVLQAEFYKRFERSLNVSEAYRGLNRQTAVWQKYINGDGPMAARPGTSNHGWAVAVDFGSDVNTYGSATKYWMDRNAPRWGWHPVGNSFGKPEAWHFEFKPNTATETIPASSGAIPFPEKEEDEDVATIQAVYLDKAGSESSPIYASTGVFTSWAGFEVTSVGRADRGFLAARLNGAAMLGKVERLGDLHVDAAGWEFINSNQRAK